MHRVLIRNEHLCRARNSIYAEKTQPGNYAESELQNYAEPEPRIMQQEQNQELRSKQHEIEPIEPQIWRLCCGLEIKQNSPINFINSSRNQGSKLCRTEIVI